MNGIYREKHPCLQTFFAAYLQTVRVNVLSHVFPSLDEVLTGEVAGEVAGEVTGGGGQGERC